MEKKKRPGRLNKGESSRAKVKGSDNESKPTRPKKDTNRQGTKSQVASKKR